MNNNNNDDIEDIKEIEEKKIEPNTPYGIIDIDDENFSINLIKLIKEYGIVVIKNVMAEDKCDEHTEQCVCDIMKVSNFNKYDCTTWIKTNLPQQVRPGLFHEVICNTPNINNVRFNPNIIKIFKSYYSKLNNKKYNDIDLVVSNDGLNIKPAMIAPFSTHTYKDKDWAHVDQVNDVDKPYKCIQGQMVLSNSTACFRASPKSHLLFEEYVKNPANTHLIKGNFLKFNPVQYYSMKTKLEQIGGHWQIPILAKKGDFIIWTSSTVHSALLNKINDNPTIDDKWNGWRHVVYICYRPREEFTEEELRNKYAGFMMNRVSNHWGNETFSIGFNRWNKKEKYSAKLTKYIKNPELVYKIKNMMPILDEKQQYMMGNNNYFSDN